MERILKVEYQKCTGCRLCELVCSVTHDGISNPSRSRVKGCQVGGDRDLCAHDLPAV